MADDKRLDIDIALNADTAGAREAGQALETVKQTAREAGQAIDEGLGQNLNPQPVRELAAAQGEVKAATADMAAEFAAARQRLDELSKSQETLATASDKSSVAIRNQRQALGAILEDLPKLQAAFGNISAVLLSGFAGAAIGKKIYDSIVTPIWNAIEEANKSTDAFVLQQKSKLEQLNDVKVTFDGINAAAEKSLAAIEKRVAEIQNSFTDLSGSRATRTQAAERTDALAERRELTAAGDNEPLKASIKARFEAQEKLRLLDDEEANAKDEIAKQQALRVEAEAALLEATNKLKDDTKAAADAQKAYLEIVLRLTQAGYDAEKLIGTPSDVDSAISGERAKLERMQPTGHYAERYFASGKTSPEDIANQSALIKALIDFPGARAASEKASTNAKPSAQEAKTAEQALAAIDTKIIDLTASLKGITAARDTAKIELGEASARALIEIKDAINKTTEAVREKRADVDTAFRSGDPAAQQAAQQSLAAEQNKLSDLQRQFNEFTESLNATAQKLGPAFTEGAESVKTGGNSLSVEITSFADRIKQRTEEAKLIMAASAATAVEGSAIVSEGLKQSADIAVQATQGAMDGVKAQIASWGQQVVFAFSSVSESLQGVVAEMSSIRAQLNATDTKADTALSQIRNGANR